MRFSALLVLAISFAGCSPSHIPGGAPSGMQIPQKLIEEVSYNEVFNRVLEPKCIGCHSGDAKIKLDTYASSAAHAKEIERAAVLSRRMPKQPFTDLEPEQFQLLAAWIRAGAPDRPINGSAAPSPIALEPTFASIQTKILIPRCASCHRAGGEAWQVSLDSAKAMIESPLEVVIPGSPEESGLTIVIQEGARKKMPPLKSGIGALTGEEAETVSEWIRAGARE